MNVNKTKEWGDTCNVLGIFDKNVRVGTYGFKDDRKNQTSESNSYVHFPYNN